MIFPKTGGTQQQTYICAIQVSSPSWRSIDLVIADSYYLLVVSFFVRAQ